MRPTKYCKQCEQVKALGAFNNSDGTICSKCFKEKKQYKEGYFKPEKDVYKIFIG